MNDKFIFIKLHGMAPCRRTVPKMLYAEVNCHSKGLRSALDMALSAAGLVLGSSAMAQRALLYRRPSEPQTIEIVVRSLDLSGAACGGIGRRAAIRYASRRRRAKSC